MVEFIKKAAEWVLDKEQEAARNCEIDLEDVDKQIKVIETKRDELKANCAENISEMEHILNRLNQVKATGLRCKTK